MQLSFRGEFLRDGYQHMLANGSLDAFRLWQIVDFAFMAAYGVWGVATVILTGRLYPAHNQNREISYLMASAMVVAPLLDTCENLISLYTLSDPLGFPLWLGVPHSLFALVKWGIGAIVLLWALGSWAVALHRKLRPQQ
jgi:hypothetical protein